MCCFLSVLEGPVLVEICVIGLFTDIVSAHLFGLARHVLFQISFFGRFGQAIAIARTVGLEDGRRRSCSLCSCACGERRHMWADCVAG